MARYDSKADFKVHDMKSMGKTRDSEALQLLQRISHQVQPIMRRREWRVPLLSEFFPANPNLLGLNIGGGGGRTREIKVRLRPAREPDSFLPYESILGTMLHELVHNVRGPHDSAFYKLLDEITAECEELMARGIGGTGVGFDGPSCGRLGSHAFIPMHNPAPGRLRESALKAAEERAKRQRIMPAGPCRLGGGDGAAVRYATPAAAAAAAAERRCSDNRWCPCERLAGALSRAVAKAEAQRAQQQGQQGGSGAGARGGAAGGSAASSNTNGDLVRSVPAPTDEELEADLVRRIEDGVIDLTLDSDDESADDAAGYQAVRRGPQQAGAGPPGEPRPGALAAVSTGAADDATGGNRGAAPAVAVGPSPAGQPGRGPAAGGESIARAAGLRSGDVCAGTDGWTGPGSGSSSSSALQHVRVKREAAQVERGRCVATAEELVPDGGLAGTSGIGSSAERGSGLVTRRVQVQAGKGAASATPVLGAGAGCEPACGRPAPRPPLQVLPPRNPAAAAAAAAALARMQQSGQQQMPHTHQMRRSDPMPQRQHRQEPPDAQQEARRGQQPHQQGVIARSSPSVFRAKGPGLGSGHPLGLPGGKDALARDVVGAASVGDGGSHVIDLTDD